MRFGERAVERERALGCLACERERAVGRCRSVYREQAQSIGETGIGAGKRRVTIDRLAEVIGGSVERITPALMPEVAATQVEVVGAGILGAGEGGACRWARRSTGLRTECNAKRVRDAAGNVVLHGEDILHLPLVDLRPHRETVGCV